MPLKLLPKHPKKEKPQEKEKLPRLPSPRPKPPKTRKPLKKLLNLPPKPKLVEMSPRRADLNAKERLTPTKPVQDKDLTKLESFTRRPVMRTERISERTPNLI